MSKKGTRLGRRKLHKKIADLQAQANLVKVVSDHFKAAAETVKRQQVMIDNLKRDVKTERDRAASITSMVGGFELRIVQPEQRGRFDMMRMTVDIAPDLYLFSFEAGGGGNFRDLTGYFRNIGYDVARKVEKCLEESAAKMGANRRF